MAHQSDARNSSDGKAVIPATTPARWKSFASSGGTVVAIAIAAAVTSYTSETAVGIAAWVAVAVVGASAMISTARNAK